MKGVSDGGAVGVRVRVGGGGWVRVGVMVGVSVCVREGGMNSVSVGVGERIAAAVVLTSGGWRRVEVACTPGLGRSSTVGVG
jgi:hypothetical protein